MRYGEQLDGWYSTTKHVQETVAGVIGRSIANPPGFDFIPVIIGGLLLVRIVVQRGWWSPHAVVALLMAAEIGAVTVGLGVDFYRYYLPILLVNSVLVGIAFGEAARVVRERWLRTASRPNLATQAKPPLAQAGSILRPGNPG
jgi:hypothetical protein